MRLMSLVTVTNDLVCSLNITPPAVSSRTVLPSKSFLTLRKSSVMVWAYSPPFAAEGTSVRMVTVLVA